MKESDEIEAARFAVLFAARDSGIASILFRNALAQCQDLNLTESLCLTMLGIRGSSSPGELARYSGLTSGATTTLLDRLEKRGIIRREPNPRDRRALRIVIEDSYAEQSKKLVAAVQLAHRELISSYGMEELRLIKGFLEGFTENLRVHTKELVDLPWPLETRED